MLTACGECVGKQAAETQRGMQGIHQCQSLVLFKTQPQEGDEVLIPWISDWLHCWARFWVKLACVTEHQGKCFGN